MKFPIAVIFFLLGIGAAPSTFAQSNDPRPSEPHRPAFHFTPATGWMNDPNGMVYYKGVYHLFFQHYPDKTVWGPMHWGHATSTDLVNWRELPIALFPDSLGYIFSGSAVVDFNNTTGFGKNGQIPLVAIFTHHNPKLEKPGGTQHEYQSLAYSVDDGKTWKKYENNPVLPNPGISDFRDPKVTWFESGRKWIMTLATKDRISFYSSPDLKAWTKESEIGNNFGAHGGVWECPDLFPLKYQGRTHWVLLVNINPGGPNKGSGTQYFIGDFDGKEFHPSDTLTRWMDYGPDNYAGITWSNTGERKILVGWMSNWLYADKVPTEKWRSAATIPRELGLRKINGALYLTSVPVNEIGKLLLHPIVQNNVQIKGNYDLTTAVNNKTGLFRLKFRVPESDVSVILSNEAGESVEIGYNSRSNDYFIDRTYSGKTKFSPGFSGRHTMKRLNDSRQIDFDLVVDLASVELFADQGLNVMTEIFFPSSPFTKIALRSVSGTSVSMLRYDQIRASRVH